MLNHSKLFHFIGCHHQQTGIDEALQVLVLSNSYDCVTTFLYILYYFSDNKFIKIAQTIHMAVRPSTKGVNGSIEEAASENAFSYTS